MRGSKDPDVFSDKVPSDPDVIAALQESEYFAGAVGPANAEYGTLIAEYALEKGYKSCIIRNRSTGGSEYIRPVSRPLQRHLKQAAVRLSRLSIDSADNIQPFAENALIANPEIDFVYGTGSDYGIGAADAIKNQGLDVKVLTSGLDSAVLEYLRLQRITL